MFTQQPVIDQLIRSKRKSIAFQITPEAQLVVRAPDCLPFEIIQQMVLSRQAWIVRKQNQARDTKQRIPKREYTDGEYLYYLGVPYRLTFVEGQGTPIIFDGKEFLFDVAYANSAKEKFVSWYRDAARLEIEFRAEKYSGLSGLKYHQLQITNAQKRWGSCGANGTLNFSWHLIMAPSEVIDYVVVHEIVHLEIKNHSKRFWKKVISLYPQYYECRRWLRQNEIQLMSF